MLSAEDMAATKVAIEICNNPELKREILCVRGSDYDINKRINFHDGIRQWNEIVEKKATVLLGNLGVGNQLQEKVMGIVLSVGRRMLTWAKYHEGILGISLEYSADFLNNSFLTQLGIIDNKKAAEELMKDESLSIKQKYTIACLYCFTDDISALYKQMTKEEFYDAERPQRVKQPQLVKFWSYYLMDDIDKLRGEKNLNEYRLDIAVVSGSKAAVEYCLEKTELRRKKHAIMHAAMKAVECRLVAGPETIRDLVTVFEHERYEDHGGSWVPSDYYVDIFSFLLSKMGEDEKIEFLKRDIEGANYGRVFLSYYLLPLGQKRSKVPEYFLNWPYQGYFMEIVGLMWGFLPEIDYAVLLLRICDKIESDENDLKYGEGKSYNYSGLLREFWCQSPEHYKRYVLSNQEVKYRSTTDSIETTEAAVALLTKLFTLEKPSYEDGENIKLILASTTSKEKENIVSSKRWISFCLLHMEAEKFEMLNRLLRNFFLSQEEVDQFKRELSFIEEAQHICIKFIEEDKLNAAEAFIKWSTLPEGEINQLKKEMIYSAIENGSCMNLFFRHKKVKAVDQFIRWCLPSEEDVKAFKKELFHSPQGQFQRFVHARNKTLVDEFMTFCIPSDDVNELKKSRNDGMLHGK